MYQRFGLILAGLALSLLALASVTQPMGAAQAFTAPKPQFPTLTPTLTPPPLPGCWPLDQSQHWELEGGLNSMAASPNDGGITGGVHSPVAAPLDTLERRTLISVSATGPNDVWAVGGRSSLVTTPLVLHWDGAQWAGQQLPWTGERVMNAVAAIAPNDVWVVGSQGHADHWDGTAWTTFPVPGNRSPTAIAGAAGNDVWAIAENGMIHWDGIEWAVVPLPSANKPTVYGIAARAANDAWLAGDQYNAAIGRWQTLTAHWNGTAWTIVPSANAGTGANHLRSVTSVAADNA